MRIVDYEPRSWFLAEEDGALYLDLNCSSGPAGFTMLVRLTDEEYDRVARDGHSATDTIATQLQYHAVSLFKARNLGPEWQARLGKAVDAWLAARRAEE